MTKKLKVSSTAYRILLLLLHLNEDRFNVSQLNEIFSKDAQVARYFSKDVILKYISTLRVAGYKITKPCLSNKYTYELEKSPVLSNFNERQLKVLAIMDSYIKSLHQIKLIEKYQSFLKKLQKIIPDEQVQLLNKELLNQNENPEADYFRHEHYAELIKKIESLKKDKCRVSIKYKLSEEAEEKQVIFELKNIKYDKNEVYISGYSPVIGQTQLIKLGQIIDAKQLPTQSQYNQILSPVIFKLKGNLAKVYRPYENEKVVYSGEKSYSITVTAYIEDQDILLNRLLKYGDSCEVLYPKNTRDSMVKIIGKTLNNYE